MEEINKKIQKESIENTTDINYPFEALHEKEVKIKARLLMGKEPKLFTED